MVLMRAFDAKAIALQRTGQLGTYASMLGKEAVEAGIGAAMANDDVLLPQLPRERRADHARRVDRSELLLYWGGDERGNDFPGPRARFSVLRADRQRNACTRPASRYAIKLRARAARRGVRDRRRRDLEGRLLRGDQRRRRVAAAAGLRRRQQPVGDLGAAHDAERGADAGAESASPPASTACRSTATTSSPCAMRVADALEKARAGGGPTLIEAVTYRLADHTTADDADALPPRRGSRRAWKREPILRLRNYLDAQGRVGQGARGSAAEENATSRCRRAAQAYHRHAAAGAGADVRAPVRDAAGGLCRAARRDSVRRSERDAADHAG